MATQKELEARIAQLEAQLADKGISAPASPPKASAKAPTSGDMLLEEVHIPIYAHEVEPPDLAPVADEQEPPDLAPVADMPAPGPELAPVQIGTRRALRVMQ